VLKDVRYAVGRVATSGARLSVLAGGGLSGAFALARFLRSIVPKATHALFEIRHLAEAIPDDRMRAQALSSTDTKAYMVSGG